MLWLDILVPIVCVLFIGGLIFNYVYRKKHNLPTGDCACCSAKKRNLLDEYHKMYGCNCQKNADK